MNEDDYLKFEYKRYLIKFLDWENNKQRTFNIGIGFAIFLDALFLSGSIVGIVVGIVTLFSGLSNSNTIPAGIVCFFLALTFTILIVKVRHRKMHWKGNAIALGILCIIFGSIFGIIFGILILCNLPPTPPLGMDVNELKNKYDNNSENE